jgi:di/tricarboxylate transporter
VTEQIALLLGIVVAAGVCLAYDWVAAEVVGLGVLLALVLFQLVPADRAFEGFGSDAVILILGLLIMTSTLVRTGVVDGAGRRLQRLTGASPGRLLVAVMVASALLSAFVSNTAATALLLPIVMGLARRMEVAASTLLLPLAFSSILSSSVTLVSTSTNIVVSEAIRLHGMAEMGMFELAPVGVPITVVGLVYMLTLGRRLLPSHASGADDAPLGETLYFAEVLIPKGSRFAGKTLAATGIGRNLDLRVLRILRGPQASLRPLADAVLEAGDVLLVEGTREQVLKVKDAGGLEIKADVRHGDPSVRDEDLELAEGLIVGRSELQGRTLATLDFRRRFGLQVLGVDRRGESLRRKLSEVRLELGDILLLQGARDRLLAAEQGGALRLLGSVDHEDRPRTRAILALLIFAGSLTAGSLGLVSLPVSALLGAFLCFVTRCITPEEAYRAVEWKVLLLIGSMLSLGAAMTTTGAAAYLAGGIASFASSVPPVALLGAFFVVAVVLTQPMSNQAAAIVLVPIAVETALRLGLNPRAFAMTIAIAASCSYLTPLEPSCLMVYGPGRYRFGDFVRVGLPLTLLILVVTLLLAPLVWPLEVAAG